MSVLRPLKVTLINYPEGQVEEIGAVNNPEDLSAGTRRVPFSKTLYIEQEDFMENPPSKFFRLTPGREVRLRYAYFIKCVEVVKDEKTGEVTEVRWTYDPATKGGDSPDGRKVKATLHWVSAEHAIQAEVRLYDHLCSDPEPGAVPDGKDWKECLNPDSLETVVGFVEPSLATATSGDHFQFERMGYFSVDPDSTPGKPVFNRTVTLRDVWGRIQKAGGK
jgi:glutaminyl-tRNA synthetase